jgi:DNA polymerase-3 subunit gamma/tau
LCRRRLPLVLDRVTGIEAGGWNCRMQPDGEAHVWARRAPRLSSSAGSEAEAHPLVRAILEGFSRCAAGRGESDHGLDDYGLPPEELLPALAADDPSLAFAPLDAQPLDEDDRPYDPGAFPRTEVSGPGWQNSTFWAR